MQPHAIHGRRKGEILMIGLSLYALFIIMLLAGVFLFSMVFWPDKKTDYSRRQLRKSLGMLGVALILSGIMFTYSMYVERHSASDGVIYIPDFLVDFVMWIAISIGTFAGFRLMMRWLSKRSSKSKSESVRPTDTRERVGA